MKPPKTLKIGPYTYRVTTKAADLDRQGQRDNMHLDGFGQQFSQTLAIRTETLEGQKVGPDYQRSTLVHEVLHQCLRASGVADVDDALEERIIRAIEGPLYQTLRDNPELLAYLTS